MIPSDAIDNLPIKENTIHSSFSATTYTNTSPYSSLVHYGKFLVSQGPYVLLTRVVFHVGQSRHQRVSLDLIFLARERQGAEHGLLNSSFGGCCKPFAIHHAHVYQVVLDVLSSVMPSRPRASMLSPSTSEYCSFTHLSNRPTTFESPFIDLEYMVSIGYTCKLKSSDVFF